MFALAFRVKLKIPQPQMQLLNVGFLIGGRIYTSLISLDKEVHPRKRRVVLSQFPLVWQTSCHLTIQTDTSFTPAL
jgi:hypothetical protein